MKISMQMGHLSVITIFFMAFLIFGYLLAGQFLITSSRTELRDLSSDQLSSLYNQLSNELVRTRLNVLDLRSSINDFLKKSEDQKSILQKLDNEVKTISGAVGLMPVKGSGIKVVIKVEKTQLKASYLFDMLNELRASGAEAIAVNKVRALTNSYFEIRRGKYYFDNVEIKSPFVFEAIGETQTLESAINIKGGLVSTLEELEGVAVVVSPETEIRLNARKDIEFRYAKQAK